VVTVKVKGEKGEGEGVRGGGEKGKRLLGILKKNTGVKVIVNCPWSQKRCLKKGKGRRKLAQLGLAEDG